MVKEKDPWSSMEQELDQVVNELVLHHRSFVQHTASAVSSPTTAGTGSGSGGDAVLVGGEGNVLLENQLLSAVQEAEEFLDDMRLAVDMAMNHPEKFDLPTEELHHRREKLVAWDRTMNKPRSEATKIRKAQEGRLHSASVKRNMKYAGASPQDRGQMENNDFLQQHVELQNQAMSDQDQSLGRLQEGVARVKTTAVSIHDEMKTQEQIMEDLEKDMNVVQVKIEHAMRKVGKMLDDVSDKKKIILIIVLLVVLALLVVFVFTEPDDSKNN